MSYLFARRSNGSFQRRSNTPPTEEISAVRKGRGERIVSDNSKCIRTSKGGRGLTSYFLCGGRMDVFWNDPIGKEAHGEKQLYIKLIHT
jgi:hypothetical protein